MNVLVVLHKDGPNLFIENIIRKMIDNGHNLGIYAIYDDKNSIRMFDDLDIVIKNVTALNEKMVNKYDFILCPTQAINHVAFYNKYIFSFCNMNPKFDHVRGADFVFTLSDLGEDYYNNFAYMPIGLPKNDYPVERNETKEKNILVLDTGHYPYSYEGKKQVAHMILDMCAKQKDYNIIVKPRWLQGSSSSVMTHRNNYHIFDIIDEICDKKRPDNLVLLDKQYNLQKLIDESVSVVSLCTTAFLDVALRDKGLILASGFENDDTYRHRKYYFDSIFDYAKESGCIVHYNDINNYLPNGIHCSKEFIEKAFESRENVSDKVVEVIEYVYEKILTNNQYPSMIRYDYNDYKNAIQIDKEINIDILKQMRMYCMTELEVALNEVISNSIDWSMFNEKQLELCKETEANSYELKLLGQKVRELKWDFIIENKDHFMDNDVDLGYYYDALYRKNNHEALLIELSKNSKHEPLNYYCGDIFYSRKNYKNAKECYEYCFYKSVKKPYDKYLTDRKESLWRGGARLCICYLRLGKLSKIVPIIRLLLKDDYVREKGRIRKIISREIRKYFDSTK